MDAKDFIVLQDKAVHMVGNYVAVCASTKQTEFVKVIDGIQYRGRASYPDMSNVYIDFVYLRKDGDEWYEDEDSPVAGGLELEFAEKIANELLEAVKYIRTGG